MTICPKFKNLYLIKNVNTQSNSSNGFRPDIFPLLDDRKIARIKEIRANTPQRVSIRLFICHNYKDLAYNYCDELQSLHAEQKACETNKTKYVSFFVDKSEGKEGSFYFLVFVRDSEIKIEASAITKEIKDTATWLGVTGCTFECYIFYYSQSSSLVNTFDRGALKNNFNKYCKDQKYNFLFQQIPLSKNQLCLNINGGTPKFNIVVTEM